jgi:hypothetical protein
MSKHHLFEIKILEKTASIDYVFIHGDQNPTADTKYMVEEVSRELINRKGKETSSRLLEGLRMDELECSIIQGN